MQSAVVNACGRWYVICETVDLSVEKRNMKIFVFLFALLCTSCFSFGAEFDPAACPDLSVKIFPGNNKQSVLLVTASGYTHSGLGFDYAKCRVVGKLSNNTWRTLLHFEMTPGKKSQLYYLVTIPQRAAKESDRFELAIDEPFFTGPKKTIPLQVIRNSKTTVTFTSFAKSGDQTKILRELKINLTDNTAFFTNKPDKKLKIIWYSDFFVAGGLPKGNDQIFFVWSGINHSRKADNGITVFRYKVGNRLGIFPVYEKFYLTKVE